jgi:hypothetical protein
LTASGRLFTCFFDRPLKVQPISDVNWFGRAFLQALDFYQCHVHENQVRAFARVVGTAGPGERCSYLATPADVQGLGGTPVEPFVSFPLQVFG